MPFYEFRCKNPESPYYTNPKSVYWTIKKFTEEKDKMICEITGEKLEPVIGGTIVKLKGSGWTKKGSLPND